MKDSEVQSKFPEAIFYSVGALFGGIVCSILGWAGMSAVVIGAAWTIFDEVRADRKREAQRS